MRVRLVPGSPKPDVLVFGAIVLGPDIFFYSAAGFQVICGRIVSPNRHNVDFLVSLLVLWVPMPGWIFSFFARSFVFF